MNDRYLFRAKRTDNGELVFGYYARGLDMYEKEVHLIFEPTTMFYSHGDSGFVEVDPSTICQCTGREGEWEHDIFQCDDERYEIQFCEDSLTWEAVSVFSSESIELGEFSPSEYVRLGNAIDNPELLEVGE